MANAWLDHVKKTKLGMGKGVLLRDVLKAAKKTYRKTVGVKSVKKSRKSKKGRGGKTAKKARGKTAKKARGKTAKKARGKKRRTAKK
jgi:hypothetical protein